MLNRLKTNLARIHLSQAFWLTMLNCSYLVLAALNADMVTKHPREAAWIGVAANLVFEVYRLLTGKPPAPATEKR